MVPSDEALLQSIKRGSDDAMGQLITRWYPRIYAYAYRMTGHEQDAQDITQETFLAVLRHIHTFHLWRKFQSWLFAIAHHKCIDFFRLHNREIDAPEKLDELSVTGLDERILDAVALEQAIVRLPALQREAIVLQYFDGFTPTEIAHMTHTPPSTVQWRLSTARSRLATLLKEEKQ